MVHLFGFLGMSLLYYQRQYPSCVSLARRLVYILEIAIDVQYCLYGVTKRLGTNVLCDTISVCCSLPLFDTCWESLCPSILVVQSILVCVRVLHCANYPRRVGQCPGLCYHMAKVRETIV